MIGASESFQTNYSTTFKLKSTSDKGAFFATSNQPTNKCKTWTKSNEIWNNLKLHRNESEIAWLVDAIHFAYFHHHHHSHHHHNKEPLSEYVPEDADNGEPKPLFDAVHLTQHQVHVDEDQHVPHHQLVRVLHGHNDDKKFTLLHFKHTSHYTLNNRRDNDKNITITIISASLP